MKDKIFLRMKIIHWEHQITKRIQWKCYLSRRILLSEVLSVRVMPSMQRKWNFYPQKRFVVCWSAPYVTVKLHIPYFIIETWWQNPTTLHMKVYRLCDNWFFSLHFQYSQMHWKLLHPLNEKLKLPKTLISNPNKNGHYSTFNDNSIIRFVQWGEKGNVRRYWLVLYNTIHHYITS